MSNVCTEVTDTLCSFTACLHSIKALCISYKKCFTASPIQPQPKLCKAGNSLSNSEISHEDSFFTYTPSGLQCIAVRSRFFLIVSLKHEGDETAVLRFSASK